MSGFDETFDWVVVGSGAGSMASALVMRQAGKSVLILEKTAFVGGTTAKSGGVIWVPNNRFMAADGDADSGAAAITYLDAVCEDLPGSSHEKRLAYVHEAPRMIDFLVGQASRSSAPRGSGPTIMTKRRAGAKPRAALSPGRSTKRNLARGSPSCGRAFSR